MTPKALRLILVFPFILILLTTLLSGNALALQNHPQVNNLPPLGTFVNQLRNGQSGEVRGIYIPEILAAPVIHQPEGSTDFVSSRKNIVTQFDLASHFGSAGFLAHNYLAGRNFSLLEVDQVFYLIYGDGQTARVTVTEILRYQALEPTSSFSEFIDLKEDNLMTTAEAFSKVYKRPGQVILQTCIARGNIPNWGRLFVIAELSSD